MKTLITDKKILDIYEYLKGKSVWVDYKRIEWLRYIGVLSYEQRVSPGWLSAKTRSSDDFYIRTNYTLRRTIEISWPEFKKSIQIALLQDTCIRIDGKKEGGIIFNLYNKCGLRWLPGVDQHMVSVKGDIVFTHGEGSPDLLEIGFTELEVLFGKSYRKAFKRNNPKLAKILACKDAEIEEYRTITTALVKEFQKVLVELKSLRG